MDIVSINGYLGYEYGILVMKKLNFNKIFFAIWEYAGMMLDKLKIT